MTTYTAKTTATEQTSKSSLTRFVSRLLYSSSFSSAATNRRSISTQWEIQTSAPLHTGPMGYIRIGFNKQSGEKVVIKHYSFSFMQKMKAKDWCERFQTWRDFKYNAVQEAKIMSILKHPNIVEFYDYVVDDERKEVFIVMEFMGVENLGKYFKKWRRKNKKQSWREKETFAVDIIRQVVSAVGYLHAHYICHRDLKPENILVVPGETLKSGAPTIKICDFGLATLFHHEKKKFLRGGPGSFLYFAPESINQRLHPGYSVDIWTIGVMSQLFGTFMQPFTLSGVERRHGWETDRRILRGQHIDIESMSENFRNFSKRALHVNPLKRATIQELASHPWLNSTTKRCRYPLKTYFKTYQLREPIDFHIPERTVFSATSDIDYQIVDEIAQGYYGWWTSYQVEEVDTDYIMAILKHSIVEKGADAKTNESCSRPRQAIVRNPTVALFFLVKEKQEREAMAKVPGNQDSMMTTSTAFAHNQQPSDTDITLGRNEDLGETRQTSGSGTGIRRPSPALSSATQVVEGVHVLEEPSSPCIKTTQRNLPPLGINSVVAV